MKKALVIIMVVALLLVGGGFGVLRYVSQNQGIVAEKALQFVGNNLDLVTKDVALQEELAVFVGMLTRIFVTDGELRQYLVLLQNHMELRPGGGFLGQYAIVKVRDAELVSWEVSDANHLDREISSDIVAPASVEQYLGISTLAFRDSNWELDFPTNAQRAQHLYNLSDEPLEFDGVIALNARVLEDVLSLTGPITVPGYEKHGAFTQANVLLKLQDVVEKPFVLDELRKACEKREKRTGIEEVCKVDPATGEKIERVTHADRENRKQILPLLAAEIMRLTLGDATLSYGERFARAKARVPELVRIGVESLDRRDIQLSFEDPELAAQAAEKNWSTVVDTAWSGDYLAVVDANLGALKSDYHIKRSLEYTVDFTGSSAEVNDISAGRMVRYRTPQIQSQVLGGIYKSTRPLATMRMNYEHTATAPDYRTSDYHAFTRLYVPRGAQWQVREWFGVPRVEEEVYGNKQAYGYKFDIFIGDTLPTMLQYLLPEAIAEADYELKIQKQPGVREIPTSVTVITSDGTSHNVEFDLTRDAIVTLRGSGAQARLVVTHL